jgi:hypothetical protein
MLIGIPSNCDEIEKDCLNREYKEPSSKYNIKRFYHVMVFAITWSCYIKISHNLQILIIRQMYVYFPINLKS